jgi:hypothetical protein
MFLTPSATPVPTSEGLCNCLSSDTDIFLSLTVATDSRIPIREDAVTANATVCHPQTLLFVADDLRVPPCEDARGADAGKQILAGLPNCQSAFRVVLNANQLGALK